MKIDPASYDAWYRSAFGSLCHRLEKDALFSAAFMAAAFSKSG